jgi:quinol monooxygenase YgiN
LNKPPGGNGAAKAASPPGKACQFFSYPFARLAAMLHVIAEIEVREGTRDAFLKEFRRIVPIVRDEDGCIEYGPAVDLAMEIAAAPRPHMVTVVEKWANEAALKAHLQSSHMEEYRKRASSMIAGVASRVYSPAYRARPSRYSLRSDRSAITMRWSERSVAWATTRTASQWESIQT